ncbi:MAG: hypothetical protein Q8807_04040, partial ['Waltheria sp.' little leaf phytoplasma]|nr:hypothetical protein ['Waltheria sp.' little leaf phytoplasma]
WDGLRRYVIPTLAFAATSWLAAGALNNALLSVRESIGGVCGTSLTTREPPFRTDSVCHLAQDPVVAGTTYLVRVSIPPAATPSPWMDDTLPATPNGLLRGEDGLRRLDGRLSYMPFFVPFRRHIGAPWA